MEGALAHFAADPWLAALVFAIVFGGAVIQMSLGMGFGLFVAPILAVIDPRMVPVSTLAIGVLTAAWGAAREWRGIVWPEVWTAAGGRVAGSALAMGVLVAISTAEAFSLVFGLMIALAVGLSVAGWRLSFRPRNVAAMGLVSGLMGTITSVGAPPLAIVYQDRPADRARPTLAAFFAIGCLISLVGLGLGGLVRAADLALAAAMLPVVLLAALTTRLIGRRADRRYRPILLGVSGAAALVLIARGIW